MGADEQAGRLPSFMNWFYEEGPNRRPVSWWDSVFPHYILSGFAYYVTQYCCVSGFPFVVTFPSGCRDIYGPGKVMPSVNALDSWRCLIMLDVMCRIFLFGQMC